MVRLHKIGNSSIDEVQEVEQFERAVDGLHLRDDIDLYVTGSNAHLLSGEFATL